MKENYTGLPDSSDSDSDSDSDSGSDSDDARALKKEMRLINEESDTDDSDEFTEMRDMDSDDFASSDEEDWMAKNLRDYNLSGYNKEEAEEAIEKDRLRDIETKKQSSFQPESAKITEREAKRLGMSEKTRIAKNNFIQEQIESGVYDENGFQSDNENESVDDDDFNFGMDDQGGRAYRNERNIKGRIENNVNKINEKNQEINDARATLRILAKERLKSEYNPYYLEEKKEAEVGIFLANSQIRDLKEENIQLMKQTVAGMKKEENMLKAQLVLVKSQSMFPDLKNYVKPK